MPQPYPQEFRDDVVRVGANTAQATRPTLICSSVRGDETCDRSSTVGAPAILPAKVEPTWLFRPTTRLLKHRYP